MLFANLEGFSLELKNAFTFFFEQALKVSHERAQ